MALSPEAQAIYDNLVETEYKKPFAEEEAFAGLVAAMGKVQEEPYTVPAFATESLSISEQTIAPGCRIFTCTPKDAPVTSPKHVLYYHGGAFLLNIMDTQWVLASELVNSLGCTLHMLDYPLAPTFTHKETYASMMEAYRWALTQCTPENFVVAGDSAGAHLVIAAAQDALTNGLPQPAQLIALSPWIDFGNKLPGKAEREDGDPVIGMVSLLGIPAVWCGDAAQNQGAPNLQHGPFAGMAPVYVQVGSTEALLVDAIELERLVTAAGGTCELEIGEGLWHTYALYPDMPEGRAAVEAIKHHIEQA